MREYEVTLPGGLATTMQLDEADTKRLNARPVDAKQAPAPANKASQPQEKKG